jgi:hypothetical protein
MRLFPSGSAFPSELPGAGHVGESFRYRKRVSGLSASGAFGQIGRVCADGRPSRAESHWSSAARRTLVASLSAEDRTSAGSSLSSLVAGCDQDELVSLVLSEGVAGPAYDKLGPFLAPAQRARLLTAMRQQTVRHLGRLAWLQRFGAALEAVGATWVVLKGPVLAEMGGGTVTRTYADLDLMVPGRQLRLAIHALEGAGAVVADQDWTRMLAMGKGELTMAIQGSPLIDLHWHLVYLRSARDRFMISTDELLERRQALQLRGIDAWALERTDFAAHVALHASSQGAQRLRRLVDIQQTLIYQAPDWDVLVRRCRAWRVALPVGAMLNAARHTLGAAVPEEVVKDLAGGKLERLVVRQVRGWVPSGRLPGGRSVRTGLSRSLRDGLLATSVQLTSESWRAVGALVRPKPAFGGDEANRSNDSICSMGFERFMDMVSSADCYGHLSGRDGKERARS